MKFAHMADCHIGSFREPKLNELSTKAFEHAINICIEERVDFVLIAGDLFNNPLPGIEKLKSAVTQLKRLKDNSIPVYGIPGSHDFSPSGKTMIDVLENAGLFINVCKGNIENDKLHLSFTIDPKTKIKITGVIGKRGMLDKKIYEALDLESLEQESGKKIFLFHTLLSELKPEHLEHMDSLVLSLLPKGFEYYAGGHVHIVEEKKLDKFGTVVYPGPLFPNSFSELEDLKKGGFYIVENKPRFVPIITRKVKSLNINVHHKTALAAEQAILESIEDNYNDCIVTIRIEGELDSGKKSDIDFKAIFEKIYEKGAYFVMKNTNKLVSREFQEIRVDANTPNDVEDKLITEHLGQVKIAGLSLENEKALTKKLLKSLAINREEGEKVADFEERITKDTEKILMEFR